MADEVRGAFVIAEHWIRVPLGHEAKTQNHSGRTIVSPKHLFLRIIVSNDREKASTLRQQLVSGQSFFELARANSVDLATAADGGYLGDLAATQFDPTWSATALKLEPGELSDVVEANGRWLVLQRMPRNFRMEAGAVFNKAMDLRKQGRRQESAAELLNALKIYPRLLRALTYLGITFGEMGNPQTGAGILEIATRLFPRDAGAHFNLGIAYGALGKRRRLRNTGEL